jgi:hypothetical protein
LMLTAKKKPAGVTPSASSCDCRLYSPVPPHLPETATTRLTKD